MEVGWSCRRTGDVLAAAQVDGVQRGQALQKRRDGVGDRAAAAQGQVREARQAAGRRQHAVLAQPHAVHQRQRAQVRQLVDVQQPCSAAVVWFALSDQ